MLPRKSREASAASDRDRQSASCCEGKHLGTPLVNLKGESGRLHAFDMPALGPSPSAGSRSEVGEDLVHYLFTWGAKRPPRPVVLYRAWYSTTLITSQSCYEWPVRHLDWHSFQVSNAPQRIRGTATRCQRIFSKEIRCLTSYLSNHWGHHSRLYKSGWAGLMCYLQRFGDRYVYPVKGSPTLYH